MKRPFVILGCIALSVMGFKLATCDISVSPIKQNEIAAATVLDWKVDGLKYPRNTYYDGLVNDNVKIDQITDSVKVKKDTVTVTDTVYVKVKVKPKHTTDTVYIQVANLEDGTAPVKNKNPGTGKVFTPDEESLKLSKVSLYIDGKKVYSTDSVAPVQVPQFDVLQEQ